MQGEGGGNYTNVHTRTRSYYLALHIEFLNELGMVCLFISKCICFWDVFLALWNKHDN